VRGNLTRSGVHIKYDTFREYTCVTDMVTKRRSIFKSKRNLSKHQRQIIAPKEFFLWDAKPKSYW